MSIKTEIDRIKQSKADIISALTTKGVTVPSDASIDDLSALVEAIEVATDPVLQSKTVSPTTSSQTVTPDTGYDGLSQVTVNAMTTATQATPSISVSSSGLITASATQTAGYVSAGTKSATKQLTTKAATTITPGTSNKTAVAKNVYTTGAITVKGDSNLVASNIKSGVSIFGVTGSLEVGSGGTNLETCEVTINANCYDGVLGIGYTTVENGVVSTSYSGRMTSSSTTISNVLCGSSISILYQVMYSTDISTENTTYITELGTEMLKYTLTSVHLFKAPTTSQTGVITITDID